VRSLESYLATSLENCFPTSLGSPSATSLENRFRTSLENHFTTFINRQLKYEKYREKCNLFLKISKQKKKKCVSLDPTFTLTEPDLGSIRLAFTLHLAKQH
jgi:hypothetical protein